MNANERHLLDVRKLQINRSLLAQLLAGFVAAPENENLLRRIATIQRELGDLSAASKSYKQLVSRFGANARDKRAYQILYGLDSEPENQDNLPAPFVLIDYALDDKIIKNIQSMITNGRHAQSPALLKDRDSAKDYLDATRWKGTIHRPATLANVFEPIIYSMFKQVCRRLLISAFEISRIECKILQSEDGDFFLPHVDTGPGLNRVFTFIYYFEVGPRDFEGGDLLLYDDTEIMDVSPLKNIHTRITHQHNRLLFFPAKVRHESLPVKRVGNLPFGGRYAVVGHVRGNTA